jgi:peptidoglycan/LPS O-acetylase OafA/YrhL
VTGATAVTATVSVASTAPTSAALHNPFTRLSAPAAGSVLAFTIFFGIPRRRRRGLHLLSLLSVAFFAILGCGNSGSTNPGNTGTSAGSYVVTVTATATGIAPQTTIVNVTVN